MDFTLDGEQTALRDAVRALLKGYDAEHRREVVAEDPGFDEGTWGKLAEMGLLGLPFSEDDGGMGAGPVELSLVAEEIGRVVAPEPYVESVVMAGGLVAAAGTSEQGLIASGRPYLTATRRYGSTAYGWALQDTTSFVKVLADPETRLLLGAHLIGPQASILIQPLVQAMCLGSTIDDVATGVLYIHPALTEVVEQAVLGLGVEDDTAMPVHIKAAED